jgi:hypothetical protein
VNVSCSPVSVRVTSTVQSASSLDHEAEEIVCWYRMLRARSFSSITSPT